MQEGDILRAYANNNLVGSINIIDEHLTGSRPIDLVAHGSVDLSDWDGPILPGYDKGDEIEIRLFSIEDQVELRVESDLNVNVYGENEQMSFGTATVFDAPALPTSAIFCPLITISPSFIRIEFFFKWSYLVANTLSTSLCKIITTFPPAKHQ